MTIFGTVWFNDLHRFDLLGVTWNNMSGLLVGPQPFPRRLPAFAAVGSRLYLFGGADSNNRKLRNNFQSRGCGDKTSCWYVGTMWGLT